MASKIKPSRNVRSNPLPVDEETESVIVTGYKYDADLAEWIPNSDAAILEKLDDVVFAITEANRNRSVDLQRLAAEALGGQRVVTPVIDGYVDYAANTELTIVTRPFWLTKDAADEDDVANLLAIGIFNEPSWTWTVDGPIYLDINGLLTQTVPVFPSAAFRVQLATALTPTTIYYNPQIPTVLA